MEPQPTLTDIQTTRQRIDPYIVETPIWHWRNRDITEIVGHDTQVLLKLELFQHTGTFKARGAINNILSLDEATRRRGVTAVSAGNHAIALSYAGQTLNAPAKVVMPQNANPARVALCRSYDAEVVLMPNVHAAFAEVERIEKEEGRTFVHPFEGRQTILGTATVGYELMNQLPDLDAVIIPVGGGGLCAGIATAVKLMSPHTRVYAVEPEGADTMRRSLASGQPEPIDAVRTIADSLGAPFAAPYSFALCQKYVDELVLVNDDDLRRAMLRLYHGTKLAVEPAGAATTAALVGPLRQKLQGQRVALIACGSNIDIPTFAQHIAAVTP
ncbi:MAG: threonine/serine dehydratase [Ardenticatenaceae bacterium]|nr:threonine/serine dehydratase [Ardenticatenaceae bacterium]